MSPFEIIRSLEAYRAGRPLPRGKKLRQTIASPQETLIVAFVRMGGESLPWGIAYGKPGEAPKLLTVPDPRKRDQTADMMSRFAPDLLRHLGHPAFGDGTTPGQIWFPNPSHFDMCHNLAFAYTWTKGGGTSSSDGIRESLRGLGRAAHWLFLEGNRPGQQAVIIATDALRSAFTFPVEQVRQGHLGYLLALLSTTGDRKDREAVARASERVSVGITMDPGVEKHGLAGLIDSYNEAIKQQQAPDKQVVSQIDTILKEELLRRFNLTCTARQLLVEDKRGVNKGCVKLATRTIQQHDREYLGNERRLAEGERAFIAPVEGDHGSFGSAIRYNLYNLSTAEEVECLVDDDPEIQEELIATGEAIRGRISAVLVQKVGRSKFISWELEIDTEPALHIRVGERVCLLGNIKIAGKLAKVEPFKGGRRLVIEDLSPKGDTSKSEWRGQEVVWLGAGSAGIIERKAWEYLKAAKEERPGDWLVHDSWKPRTNG